MKKNVNSFFNIFIIIKRVIFILIAFDVSFII